MDINVPIFTLSFGEEADKEFLRKLSLKNSAFSRHIYEAADASLQLQQFYKQISSPLMSNVTFKYEDDINNITRVNFPIYFRGCDIVVCGRYPSKSFQIIKSLFLKCIPQYPSVWIMLDVTEMAWK